VDTTPLAGAYLSLIAAARALPREDPVLGDELSVADWILAHSALNDAALAETAAQVLAGRQSSFDNRNIISADALGSVISAQGWAGLIELVLRTATELIGAVALIPDAQADRLVQVRMVNRRGMEVFADRIAWRDLIDLRAREQIPGHTAQLLRLRARGLRY
jgi:hypothetical protein